MTAFRQLVERHQNAVIGTVTKMLGNPSDAEDIAQQVFLRIWRNAKHYRPDAKFTTYIFTITRNLVFNETRRRGRKREVSSDEREENSNHLHRRPAGPPTGRRTAPGGTPAGGRCGHRLAARDPAHGRGAPALRAISYEEIANVLSLSVSAVKSLLFRARTSLREALSGYLGGCLAGAAPSRWRGGEDRRITICGC